MRLVGPAAGRPAFAAVVVEQLAERVGKQLGPGRGAGAAEESEGADEGGGTHAIPQIYDR